MTDKPNPYRCVELLASSLHLLYKLARGGKHHEQDHSDAERISTTAAEALAVPTLADELAEQAVRSRLAYELLSLDPRDPGPSALAVPLMGLRSLVRIIDHARAEAAAAGELAEDLRRAARVCVELTSLARHGDEDEEGCRRIAAEDGWDPDWLFPREREAKDADALAGWLHGQARSAVKPWPLRGELADEGRSIDQRLISP